MDRLRQRLEAGTRRNDSGCWIWQRTHDRDGYGVIKVNRRTLQFVHRVSYELHTGPIPDGLQLDHLCRVRDCLNPSHLEPVTSLTNTMRSPIAPAAINSRKTRCNNGHPLAGVNLYTAPDNSRQCRTCHRERVREYRQRKAQTQIPKMVEFLRTLI